MDRIGVSHNHLAKQRVAPGGVVPVPEPSSQPEIPVLLQEHDGVISRLFELLDALEIRVAPVMSPSPVSSGSAGGDAAMNALQCTELGARMRTSIDRTCYAISRLEDIVSRIQL